jgi:sulfur-oxidizing protein SoxY
MTINRRQALQATGAYGALGLFVAAGVITPEEAQAQQAAWNKAAFDTKDVAGTVKALGGDAAAVSDKITVTGPEIAENGAVVPVGVTTTLPNVTLLALLVEKNPNALAASFVMSPDNDPFVTTRVKMGQSSDVYALVKSDGKFHMAKREIKVTLGGCGG